MLYTEELNRDALFCDETADYRVPAEPERESSCIIRFRTAADNADTVYMLTGRTEFKMHRTLREGNFDYYEVMLPVGDEQIRYEFEVRRGEESCRYNKLGADGQAGSAYCFCLTPGFHTPEWAKGAVMYQIFTDRFRNGNPENDVQTDEYAYLRRHTERVEDWNCPPAAFDVNRFYGGDLQGVEEKLDYLEQLGVEVIYFNPLFVSPSNHKYDIQDYDYIDPHFAVILQDEGGLLPEDDLDNRDAVRYVNRVTRRSNLEAGNAFFARLVDEIHRRGMRVILDGVFNHCGSFNKWLDRERIYENKEGYEPGAYVARYSPYHSFFDFERGSHWPYNGKYDGWWGHETLPKLNYEESPSLWQYIMHVGRKWVGRGMGADGWRLDVAADLGHSPSVNHEFWKDFRRNVKEENPEAIILAEHYGDPGSWIEGDQWDSVMNYDAFMEPVTWFLTGMEKHSDQYREEFYGNSGWFFNTMNYNMSKFQRCSLDVAMNELSNHDHSRFLTRTNRRVGRLAECGSQAAAEGIEKCVFREAVIMQMTLPGAPTLYYGDEAGQVGWTDPDSRRTYPWGNEDWELVEFHRYAILMHRKLKCLRLGSYKPLGGGSHWLSYGRFTREESVVVVINNNREEVTVTIPVWQVNVPEQCRMRRLIQTTVEGYNVGKTYREVSEGMLTLHMKPQSSAVYITEDVELE